MTDLVARLRAAGCVFAEQEASVLSAAAGSPADLERMLAQRETGAPLEYVVGWARFGGLRIAVGPGVFIPRRRSEFLLETALARIPADATVLDLCCGSGALAAAVLARRPATRMWACDADPLAASWARRNLPASAVVAVGDLFAALPCDARGRFDVIIANAPYVPSAALALLPAETRHEPVFGLDGGADGLDLHRRIAAQARTWLRPRGVLLVEVAPAEVPVLADVFEANGLAATATVDARRDVAVVAGAADSIS